MPGASAAADERDRRRPSAAAATAERGATDGRAHRQDVAEAKEGETVKHFDDVDDPELR
jgi:hypothetical protein